MFEADDGDTEKENVMKKTVRNFAVLAVFAMALTGLSLAQNPTYRVTANIPFDFNVGNQHLPPASTCSRWSMTVLSSDCATSPPAVLRPCCRHEMAAPALELLWWSST